MRREAAEAAALQVSETGRTATVLFDGPKGYLVQVHGSTTQLWERLQNRSDVDRFLRAERRRAAKRGES